MKFYKRHYKSKVFICVSLWFLMTGYSLADEPSGETIRIISDKEMPAILNLIGNQIRGNYERIITWSGKIDVKINWLWTGAKAEEFFKNFTGAKGEIPEAILQKIEEKVTFAIDMNKNFVYVDNFREKNQYLNHTTGIDLGRKSASPICSTSIFRPDYFVKASPDSFKDNKIVNNRVEKTPSKQNSRTELYEGRDDPREIFVPGGGYTWEHFDGLVKRINKFGKIEFDGYNFQMEEHKKGKITEYKIIEPSVVNLERSDPNHYIIITKIFSSQCGFNLIDWEVATGSGRVFQSITWEYESINGVYLPKRVTKKQYRLSGEVSSEEDCTYVNNKLNQKIPPETFEYQNLNLKDGDEFIDEILNKEYRYKADTRTLEPVEK